MKAKLKLWRHFSRRNFGSAIFPVVLLLVGNPFGFAQGFVNLDFEDATIISDDPPHLATIYSSSAIPGWAAYFGGGGPASYIFYNGLSLGGAIVSLQDSNALSFGPIQGNYSILLQASTASTPTTAAIGQTGTIPITSKTLSFWGEIGGMQVTFNGQPLDYLVTGSTAAYNIYSADISAYAGQTGQLLFTALAGSPFATGGLLDNIQFSSTAVPEPSELALGALGALLLGFHRWRNSFIRR